MTKTISRANARPVSEERAAEIAPDRAASATTDVERAVREALVALREMSTKETREGLARFAIPSENALGVTVADIRLLAKQLGRNHEVA
jgi:hypothetical protein